MNWVGFTIALLVLDIIPVWFLNFMSGWTIFTKILVTLGMGAVIWFIVDKRGTK